MYFRSSSTSLLALAKLDAKEEFIAADSTNPKVNSLLGMYPPYKYSVFLI